MSSTSGLKKTNNYTVYKHTSPNGKVYIGITCNDVRDRWQYGNGYAKQPLFYNAIKKYGWKNFKHDVLFEGLSKEEAEAKEVELIAKFKSNNRAYGYNIESGGNCSGKMSEETRNKVSVALKGRVVSDETRQLLSKAGKGRIVTDETRKKLRAALSGREITEEHRAKISAANKGKIHPKGWNHSEETKAKISESNAERRKAVKQSAKDGSVVAYYKSIWEAAKQTGISSSQITGCCNQKKDYKTAGGYLWSFATENAFDEWLEQNQ